MKYELSLFSLLFFTAVFIYMFWGTYIIRLNSKASTNRLFFLVCISLGIWSLGFAMANSATSVEESLFWHRFASIGWTTAYGFVLHFLLLLSHEKASLKQKSLYFLLHIPGIIGMYVFGLSNKLAPIHYNLEKIPYGWINKLANNRWDLFFNAYYISYMLIGIFVIWKWQGKLENKTIAKRGKCIVLALVLSSILGTFTDRIASSIMENPLPQIGPILILIPTWAMYHGARYYGIMRKNVTYKTDIIVTEEDRINVFHKLSWAFYGAGILGFLAEYIPYIGEEDALKLALLKGITLIGMGIIIRLAQYIKKQSLKETLTIIVLVSSIPLVLIQYLKYGSVTVWAFPMIIIISSVVFSKQTLLISITTIAISTQVLIWLLRPEVTVTINKYDYILRIVMFIIAFLTGKFINEIYVEKIKENKYQIQIQKMNLELSSHVSDINEENYDEKINIILSKIGLFFGVDRTCLCLVDQGTNTMTYTHGWNNKETGPIEEVTFKISPWIIEKLRIGEMFYLEDSTDIIHGDGLGAENTMLRKDKSLVVGPIKDKGMVQGFVGINSSGDFERWSKQEIEFLNIVANLISSAINKIQSEKEIKFMAYYDNLTKLPNWYLFGKKVNKAIDLAKDTGKNMGVIFIDLDNFKLINDTMGHSSGNELLKKVGERLNRTVGKNGIVSRSGGDEFLVLLKNIEDENQMLNTLDEIMDLFSKAFNINGRDFLITVSAGISTYPKDGHDSEKLIQNADLAMYESKKMGKNQYTLCTESMKDKIQIDTQLSNDMYQALERDEFIVHYQPQLNLRTGAINGLEALVRWNHPERGIISPGIFIPLAEKNGMINSIGEWVLRTACSQGKKWLDMGFEDIKMAVNLSGVQFLDPYFINNVENVLKETGLDPKNLELEVTESIAIKKEEYAEEILKKLNKLGVCIAIDDFGTEYSSLSRLKSLPINRIKIDMQFTQSIESSEKDRAIVMVIINLAKKLGMNVIAEGAETKEQVEFLKQESCDDVQGYYYYKPMAANDIEAILEDIYYGEAKVSI